MIKPILASILTLNLSLPALGVKFHQQDEYATDDMSPMDAITHLKALPNPEKFLDMDQSVGKIASVLLKSAEDPYTVISSQLPGLHLTLCNGWLVVDGEKNFSLFLRLSNLYKNSTHIQNLPIFHRVILENIESGKAKSWLEEIQLDSITQGFKNVLVGRPNAKIDSTKFTNAMGFEPCLILAGKAISAFFKDSNCQKIDLEAKQIAICSGPVFMQFKNLIDLSVNFNHFSSLDLNGCEKLKKLFATGIGLDEIKGSNALQDLKTLFLTHTHLEHIDLGNNAALEDILVSDNSKLKNLKGLDKLTAAKDITITRNPLNLYALQNDLSELKKKNPDLKLTLKN